MYRNVFNRGTVLPWTIRWDLDDFAAPLGAHVNAQFGANPSSKFAFYLHPSQYPQIEPQDRWKNKTMEISFAMNAITGYDYSINFGKLAPDFGNWREEQVMADLRTYSEAVATGGMMGGRGLLISF